MTAGGSSVNEADAAKDGRLSNVVAVTRKLDIQVEQDCFNESR